MKVNFKEKFDFVYIMPNKLHEKYIINHKIGFHVICEKPFVINDNKLKEILILSKKKKLILKLLWLILSLFLN